MFYNNNNGENMKLMILIFKNKKILNELEENQQQSFIFKNVLYKLLKKISGLQENLYEIVKNPSYFLIFMI